MGRPIKNPTHPLARLRDVLSTPIHKVTRKELAKKTGIPETSLRDIENGKYKMTRAVAVRIACVTPVNPRSLLAGDDPLLDVRGRPLTKDSPRIEPLALLPPHRQAREQLFLAALDTAKEKNSSLLFSFSFESWLLETFQKLGWDALLAEKLTERLPAFDPVQFLAASGLRPKNKRLAKEWEALEKRLDQEELALFRQDQIDNPIEVDPADANRNNVFAEMTRRRQIIRWDLREEWMRQHKEDETKKPITTSTYEKRPHSAKRPPA